MAFSMISRGLLRTSREILDRSVTVGSVSVVNGIVDVDFNRSPTTALPQRSASTSAVLSAGSIHQLLQRCETPSALMAIRQYSKKHASTKAQSSEKQDDESDSDSDSDDEGRKPAKNSERGDSEFWRRKMRTLHRILDVNRDGVISFDDFTLFTSRFTDLGHLTPEVSAEFMDVMKQTWTEIFGVIDRYNFVTAEQFLAEFHHRLNDKKMAKRIGRFLPYLFKAVDYDHSGHLDLDQYKLFFRCLGLSNEDAAISFAVIDKNGDGQVSLKEFVHLGRQFFLTEDDRKISKMFWGPLIDH